ncbi:hypothetical protein F66182_4566 [Fusarium sp. NRRL 66182]|nr:hypothetical protein F66182_4566 [Fusarium sp. NRRL 66182]
MEHLRYRNTTADEAIRLEDAVVHPFREGHCHSKKYFELLRLRRRLPVSSKRQEFLDLYHQHQVIVVSAETGSGKTTQIPQFILFDEFTAANRIIVCTQPRRLAATSVAKRVAAEMDVTLGDMVGYLVRFEMLCHEGTRLSYMTDGMLLQLVKDDIYFNKFYRIELKVIIMSATADVDKFLRYFGQGAHFAVAGRAYPVDIRHLQQPTPHCTSLALHTAKHIHETSPEGDILVFLTTARDIDDACLQLREATSDLQVLPLYSRLSKSEQDRIFERSTRRRCILSTNIAEASLTIDSVVYVIGLQVIAPAPISRASARQRTGRAGRTRPGVCYRLYTKDDFNEVMLPSTPPEFVLKDLSDSILQIKAMGINDVTGFDFIDKPDPEVLFRALEDLYCMKYLNYDSTITTSGTMAARLPVHPVWYNAFVKAHELECSDEMLTIAAIQTQTQQDGATRADVDLDEWCFDAFLNRRALEDITLIRTLLYKSFYHLFGAKPKRSLFESPDYETNIRKSLAWAFSHNLAFRDMESGKDHYKVLHFDWLGGIHPDSSLVGIDHPWVIYDEFAYTNIQYLTTDAENVQQARWATKETDGEVQGIMLQARQSFDEACRRPNKAAAYVYDYEGDVSITSDT